MIKDQTPVGWLYKGNYHPYDPSDWASPDFPVIPLYAHPYQKIKWKGLTEDELFKIWVQSPAETENRFAFVNKVIAILKERNNGT